MTDWYISLMADNITREDADSLIAFLQQNPVPKLTNGPKVVEFEKRGQNGLSQA